MKGPNVYKGIIGFMDVTYAELSELIGVADRAEVCRAVRGFPGARYDAIRAKIAAAFFVWCARREASS